MTAGPPPPPPSPPVWAGYRPATALRARGRPHPHRRLVLWLVAGLAAWVLVIVVVAVVRTAGAPEACAPPYCGIEPPTAPPVAADHVYTSSQYHYTVGFFDYRSAKLQHVAVAASATGLTLAYPDVASEAAIQFLALPGRGATAQSVVEAFVHERYPAAEPAYEIPHAMVGLQPGFGKVYDLYPQSGNGTGAHDRVLVMGAVKRDLAVLVVSVDAYTRFGPHDAGNPTGHPSAADGFLALCCVDYSANSVQWPGDPPR